jgi:hypothetical protein
MHGREWHDTAWRRHVHQHDDMAAAPLQPHCLYQCHPLLMAVQPWRSSMPRRATVAVFWMV